MKFKFEVESVYTDNPFYDLFVGGYINPEDLLEEEDAQKVLSAMEVVEDFMEKAIKAGHIEVV